MRVDLVWRAITGFVGASFVSARVVPRSHALHEERDELSKLIKRDRLHPETLLVMKVALKQSNMHQGEAWLREIAHPDSPKFGQYWTKEAVIDAFAPSTETVEAVLLWLADMGIPQHKVAHSNNKQWLVFDITAQQAEDLFHTDYHEYHDLDGRSLAGADRIHLPRHLIEHVDYIKPGVMSTVLPIKRSRDVSVGAQDLHKRKQPPPKKVSADSPSAYRLPHSLPNAISQSKLDQTDLSNCPQEMNAYCTAAMLNMPLRLSSSYPGTQTDFGTLHWGLYYEQKDLDSSWNEFFPDIIPQGTEPIFASIDGGLRYEQLVNWTGDGGYEPAIDLQTTIPLYWPDRVTYVQIDDEYNALNPQNGMMTPLLDAIDGSFCTQCAYNICGPADPTYDAIYPDTQSNLAPGSAWTKPYQCGTFDPPAVLAASYFSVIGEGSDHNRRHTTRICDEILKLGLQGTTFLFASGDSGVAYREPCPNSKFFYSWPNGCPWLLIVGGTMIGAGKTVHDTPVVFENGSAGTQPYDWQASSGSGFSQFFDRPEYQKSVVDAYLKEHGQGYECWTGIDYNHTKPGWYPCNGRAYPDVAADAGPIPMWLDGNRMQNGQTSSATQIFGVLLARIVGERRAAGKPNPGIGVPHHVLYAHPEVFKDVVSGKNAGCGTDGFPAAEGWDVPTGLGAPDYQKILELYLSLP